MSDELPSPFVPADADLRDFPFTPIFRSRLFGSSFHARCNDSEWRAGVTLWLKSWEQVPAGTLPDDDVDLCRLAELGRNHKAWQRVRAGALRGWVKCSDGLLHHAVVAEYVLDALARRTKASRKGKAGAAKRWGSRDAVATKPHSTGNGTAIARAMPSDSKGQGQGQRQVDPEPNGSGGHEPPSASKLLWDFGIQLLTSKGSTDKQARALIGKWRGMLKDDGGLMGIFAAAGRQETPDPVSYITKAVNSRGKPSSEPPAQRSIL